MIWMMERLLISMKVKELIDLLSKKDPNKTIQIQMIEEGYGSYDSDVILQIDGLCETSQGLTLTGDWSFWGDFNAQ